MNMQNPFFRFVAEAKEISPPVLDKEKAIKKIADEYKEQKKKSYNEIHPQLSSVFKKDAKEYKVFEPVTKIDKVTIDDIVEEHKEIAKIIECHGCKSISAHYDLIEEKNKLVCKKCRAKPDFKEFLEKDKAISVGSLFYISLQHISLTLKVICPNKCVEIFVLDKLHDHMSQCTKALFLCPAHPDGCKFQGDITAIKDHVNCYNCSYLFKPCFNCHQLYRKPKSMEMDKLVVTCPDCKLTKRQYDIESPEHKLECLVRVKELYMNAMEEQKQHYESIIADMKLNMK
jgi:hypothetical protein